MHLLNYFFLYTICKLVSEKWFILGQMWHLIATIPDLCILSNIYVSWSASELRVRIARHETGLSPPVKYFYWPFHGGTSFSDHLCYLFLVLSCFCICLLLSCGHLKLISWLLFVMFMWFCYFPIWYPWTGVVLDCITSWSLLSFLL